MASHRNRDEKDQLLGDRPTTPLDTSAPENRLSPGPVQGLPAKASVAPASPALVTAFIVASWYCSNIGVLLLNKYLLSFYGFK